MLNIFTSLFSIFRSEIKNCKVFNTRDFDFNSDILSPLPSILPPVLSEKYQDCNGGRQLYKLIDSI